MGAFAFVAALTVAQGWGLLAADDGQGSITRLGLVAAVVGPLAVEVSVLRWAWLGQRQAPLRELAGPEGFLGAAPVAGRFVRRPDLERATVRALRGGGAWAVALVGFGGTGKSTLAAVVCRRRWLRRRYRQVTFVKAGPGTAPVTILTELARRLGVADPSYATVDQARDEIETVLGRRRLLIMLDNVWTRGPLDAVLGLGPGCRVLFTTRNRDLVSTVGAAEVIVDQLTDDQALRILATWTRTAPSALPQDAYRLCARLQNLALGVAMAGAMAARGLSFTDIHARIDQDLGRIKGDFAPEYQHPTLRAAIDVSIDDLTGDARDRYLRLAVFEGRGPFPADAAAALWDPLPDPDVRDLLADLVGRSLLSTTGEGWYIAHDLQYDAIVQHLSHRAAEIDPVRAAHDTLLDGYRARRPDADWIGFALADAYLLGNLAWHLSRAGRKAELVDLLGDLRYLSARLAAHGLPDLIGDTHGTGHPRVRATARALKQSAPALTAAREAELQGLLAAQLVGRLMDHPDPDTASWAGDLRPAASWLRPITPGALAPATGPLELTISATKSWCSPPPPTACA
ncbi:NB-ARC domain-containing protein [Actinomadura meridiana]|uniref:NB-ARC domain-containing protein n=1 Tax=Actinomadura meridiana TaxID=559626 RepID=UPI0031EE9A57